MHLHIYRCLCVSSPPVDHSTGSGFFFQIGSSKSSVYPVPSLASEAGVGLNGHPPCLRLPLSPGMHSVSSTEMDYPDSALYRGPSMLEAIGSVQ